MSNNQELLEVRLQLESLQQHIDDVETTAAGVSDRLTQVAEQVTISNTNFNHFTKSELPRILGALETCNNKLDKLMRLRQEDKTEHALSSQENKLKLQEQGRRIEALEANQESQGKLNLKLAGMGAGTGAAATAILEAMRLFLGG